VRNRLRFVGNDSPMAWKYVVRAFAFWALLVVAPLSSDGTESSAPPVHSGGEGQGEFLTEVNKKLTNPVSSLWSLSFQQNNYRLDIGIPGFEDRWQSNLVFQPVLPVSLTQDWNLITRPVFTLFNSTPYPDVELRPFPRLEIDRTTRFGDTVWMEMLSPAPSIAGNWLLGLGPTFILPTANSDFTGQGKWQAGPAAIVGYLSKEFILGAFVQNWTSFGGDGSRPGTNQMNLQPIVAYFFGEGWSIGYSGNILANWEADSGDVWTVPVGLGISKVMKFGKLPVKLGVAGQYMPVHPDTFGQQWNVQFTMTPVIPKLISGTLFGD
jgi:hypothetical protein